MDSSLICFDDMDWEVPFRGVEQKVYSDGNQRLRLLKFKDDFIEDQWCLCNHVGYVLNGEMNVDFNGTIRCFKKGDGLWIKKGEESKHKVIIDKGKEVELILFEETK